MIDLGTVRPGRTIRIPFSSFDKDDGSSITMTNYAAADLLVYKDGSTTERASTSGFTATTDFDSKTGKHLAILDLADNDTAGFWAAGSEYLVAIDAVTVDGVTTGGWIARFTIGYPDAWLNTTIATLSSQTSFTLSAGAAEDDAYNGMYAIIHDVASAVQSTRVLILDYTGSTKTVTLAAGGTFTAAATDNISIIGMAPMQPATLGRQPVVDANGLIDANTVKVGPTGSGTAQTAGDIIADTNDIQSRLPAALVSGRMDSNMQAAANGVITAAVIADGAIDAATFAAGAIDAAAIATGAIDADALAADAGTELGTAVWATATRSLTVLDEDSTTLDLDATIRAAVGMASADLDTQIGTLQTSVNDLPTNAELATALAAADDAVLAAIAALNNLSSAGAQSAAEAALAAYGAALEATAQSILADTGTDGVVVAAASKTGYRLSATGVDDVLDEVVEGAYTLRQLLRGFAAAMLAKASGLDTTNAKYRDLGDSKDRIDATVDADGNRTAVTLDLT